MSPTQSNTNENVTNIISSLEKQCIPFSVLMALLLAAVWSDRKRN
jgi:hypothetical protein